jgi:purine nucleosidase
LEKNPKIKEKIEEVVLIGGALGGSGNVHQYNHDASAEWNFYWDPSSSRRVIRSGLPITLFPLGSANACPSDLSFLKQLAKQRAFDLSDLACQILAPTLTVAGGKFQHLMGDVLGAAYVVIDKLVATRKVEVDVDVDAPSEGRIFESQGSKHFINVASEINVDVFRQNYLEILKKNIKKIDLSGHSSTRKRKVYYDHDGNNDDIISLQLVLSMENIELVGVSVTPADCLLDDGLEATLRVLSVYGKTNVPVAKGKIAGPNPFPYSWRVNAKIMNGMPLLVNQKINKDQVVKEPAEDLIIKVLKDAKEPITVLLTGPCTNLAAALKKCPEIKKNIEEVVLMGGAVDVGGNVDQFNHDGSAEWNIFWDPAGAKTVFTSGLEITTFSLDSTNNVPVNFEFLKKLADQREYSASYLASMLWAPTVKNIPSADYTYFMWDVLAVAYLGCDKLCTFRKVELDVEVEAPSEGKTFKAPGSGHWVNVADNVNVDGFFRYYFAQLRNELKFDEE